jgi:hypothetical protein
MKRHTVSSDVVGTVPMNWPAYNGLTTKPCESQCAANAINAVTFIVANDAVEYK